MNVSKRSTAEFSAEPSISSDLARVDTHAILPHEYDDAPDLADRDLRDGVLEMSGTPARRERPVKAARKMSTTLRLDPDIVAYFKAGGRGWQGRINAVLRKSITR